MYKEIYKQIKKYDDIIIARHVAADPDALGSQYGLKDIILSNFPNKEVYTIGVKASKFSRFGKTDDISHLDKEKVLLIVTDTPDIRRIDGINSLEGYKNIIKIDHHPSIDHFGGIELVDPNKSSACEMIMDLVNNTKLDINYEAAEKLVSGLIADTNRFMYDYTSPDTLITTGNLIKKVNLDMNKIYSELYVRPMNEIRAMGYIAENFVRTDNNLIYIKITPDILSKYEIDPAVPGNIINEFNYLKDINVWMTLTEDTNNKNIRVSIRSKGPIVNKIAENYTGGGHELASGARPKTWEEADKLIEDIESACKEYLEKNE